MLITLQNEALSLTVDTLGAQFLSLRGSDSCEYLWQGDPKYWADRSPMLFPFIGRLWENSYRHLGKTYQMGIHGFAAQSEFSVAERSGTAVTLSLSANPAAKARYPFDFTLDIGYRLVGSTVEISYRVKNNGDATMPFGIGGHPGFNVPFEKDTKFEDYYLEFSAPCQPDRVGFSPAVFLSGQDLRYPLAQEQRIHLRHDLFDEDAVILKNMCREVTLRAKPSGKYITVSYPQMPYLGIWHWPKTDAPYVCIEPWSSLPGRQDVVEDLSCRSDLIHLPAGEIYSNTWTITIGEE